jgi:hypothetical protein
MLKTAALAPVDDTACMSVQQLLCEGGVACAVSRCEMLTVDGVKGKNRRHKNLLHSFFISDKT